MWNKLLHSGKSTVTKLLLANLDSSVLTHREAVFGEGSVFLGLCGGELPSL